MGSRAPDPLDIAKLQRTTRAKQVLAKYLHPRAAGAPRPVHRAVGKFTEFPIYMRLAKQSGNPAHQKRPFGNKFAVDSPTIDVFYLARPAPYRHRAMGGLTRRARYRDFRFLISPGIGKVGAPSRHSSRLRRHRVRLRRVLSPPSSSRPSTAISRI